MGMIDVTIRGSFGHELKQFGPADHGHVDTVAQLLEWIVKELLPRAHVLDHTLHDQDMIPPQGWERPSEV